MIAGAFGSVRRADAEARRTCSAAAMRSRVRHGLEGGDVCARCERGPGIADPAVEQVEGGHGETRAGLQSPDRVPDRDPLALSAFTDSRP